MFSHLGQHRPNRVPKRVPAHAEDAVTARRPPLRPGEAALSILGLDTSDPAPPLTAVLAARVAALAAESTLRPASIQRSEPGGGQKRRTDTAKLKFAVTAAPTTILAPAANCKQAEFSR